MKIYNTMTRKKEDFSPITAGKIKMYTCGQTVYNDIHMGNARFYVVFDAIRRYLNWRGYDVNFVQNFTDIDDKIIAKATEENCTTEEIAERYISHTLEDLAALNCVPATTNPRATEEIAEIISLVSTLIEKNFAYENNGTVYYDVTKFENYGKLSKKKIEDLEAGARVEVEAGKRNPSDFVLWKPAKPTEPKWNSPWGDGRPGWHIECSAMAKKYLGDEIDIHGGAEDLIFPHHENEIAQTEAVTGRDFARTWMHCGILTTDHKKMSKSRGNFFTLREMAEKFPHDVIRFYLISGHYRMPMEFNDSVLTAAAQGLQRIKTCHTNLLHAIDAAQSGAADFSEAEAFEKSFTQAMDDDFNTADAITAIFEMVKYTNTTIADQTAHSREFLNGLREMLEKLCGILGISLAAETPAADSLNNAEIEALISARQEARAAKNFAESDRIRDELLNMGIVLEDTPNGVRWRRA
ncbi:MAG: cysteine--tRNA ligase [Defluviitaleaceae bacterium]|nr:cysteine--tRNA ligase [Defluviitaleaceae bacterium]MCL2263000.1 cysteine--tRNA ligase [Defluviitaleaceae bacterium]